MFRIFGSDGSNRFSDEEVLLFLDAASSGNEDAVRSILSKNSNEIVNAVISTGTGVTALMRAVQDNKPSVVEILLKSGADIERVRSDGCNALHLAAIFGHNGIVSALINAGADINAGIAKTGVTPLILASQSGNLEVVKLLLASGANVASFTENGCTPLSLAAQNGHFNVASVLLSAGANVNATLVGFGERRDVTPLYLARQHNHHDIAKLLEAHGGIAPLLKKDLLKVHMDDCGIPTSKGGICLGYAHAGSLAVLARNLNEFSSIVRSIYAIPVGAITSNENFNNAIMPLFQTISLCQLQHPSSEWFVVNSLKKMQDPELAMPLVLPNKLREVGGIEKICAFSGAYSKRSLTEYLISLERSIINANRDDLAFTLVLSSHNHAITLSYNREHESWDLIDIRQACARPFQHANELAENITTYAFSQNGNAVFSTEVYATKLESSAVDEIITSWRSSPEMQALHDAASPDALNIVDSNDTSWLFMAAKTGDEHAVNSLIAVGADIKTCDKDGISPLLFACANGQVNTVRALLYNGAMSRDARYMGDRAFYWACEAGNVEIAKMLQWYGASINTKNSSGFTPLTVACQMGREGIVNWLLEQNIIIESDICSPSPLYFACKMGHERIVDALLQSETNLRKKLVESLNIPHEDAMDILLRACKNGHENIVRLLLEIGVDTNKIPYGDKSPLYLACEYGHSNIVSILMNSGADPNLPHLLTKEEHADLLKNPGVIVHSPHGKIFGNLSQRVTEMTPLQIAKIRGEESVISVLEEMLSRVTSNSRTIK